MVQQETVAILGLGGMGHGIAGSILRAGFPTVVWNRRPGPAQRLAEHGARTAENPADAVRDADAVITMVTDADAVASIAADQGMLAAMRQGALWAQMSTIGVSGIERMAALVAQQRPDVTLIDAPVSGSRAPAEQGKLVIFASGPDAVRSRIAPVFDAVGQRTVWIGPLGTGSRMKLVNNIFLAFVAEAIAASIGLGRTLGIDVDTVLDAMEGNPLVSPWANAKMRRVARDDYSAEYTLALALKDVNLALDQVEADRFAVATSLAGEWQRAVEQGLGAEDVTVMTRALARHEVR